MDGWANFDVRDDGAGGQILCLTGRLTLACLGDLPQRLEREAGPFSAVDLTDLEDIDTVGAWLAYRLGRDFAVPVTGADSDARRLMEAVRKGDVDAPYDPAWRNPLLAAFDLVGRAMGLLWANIVGTLSFLGAILIAFFSVIRHPRRFRFKALVRQIEMVGVSSLGIVGLMSFLIGIVIAQQGAVQLRQFGAEVFTVNLVGRLTLRELGVLMTAIMVAGRSGSAFAAQIGTMKLTEEIDAMRTIGVNPVEALVLPRILAAVLMMPLLGFYAAIMAIIGGAVLSALTLDIPFFTFLSRIQEVVPMHDLWVGLIKAPVFGMIIAMTGCFQGMQVSGNSEEVGLRTTAAVVQAIFLVIVLDAFFAVFFTEIGWG